MQVYNFSMKDFKNMKQFYSKGSISTEGQLFFLPDKMTNNQKLVFKKFFETADARFYNKIKTVIDLISHQEQFEVPYLVYPKGIASVDGNLCGHVMPFINGTSLKKVLNNPNISFDIKKQSLIKVGNILKLMQNIREYAIYPDFYLNDIHEDNFIVHNDTSEVYAIDLDSASLNGNLICPSMYLRPELTNYANKYVLGKSNNVYGKLITPSSDTEIYCYSIMILNFLYGQRIYFSSPEGYLKYFDYLSSLGYNSDLLNAFSKLYTNEDNINPAPFLNDLHEDPRTNVENYRRVLRRA